MSTSSPSTEYWCHQCDKIVDITTSSAFTDTLQCSECLSEFVEVVSPAAAAAAASTSSTQRQASAGASTTSQTQPQYYDTLFDNGNGSNGQQQQQQQQNGAAQASASRTAPSISFSFTTYNMPLQQANINTNTNDPFSQMMGSLFTNLMGIPAAATPQRQQSATTLTTTAATNENSTAVTTGTTAAAIGNEQTTNTSQAQPQAQPQHQGQGQGQAEQQANIPPFLQMLNSMFQNVPQQQQQQQQQQLPNGGIQFFTTVTDAQQLPNFFQQIFGGIPFVMMPQMGYRRDYHPPASQKVIDELQNITITDHHTSNGMECAVCLEALKLDEVCKQMPCHGHHIFHDQCLVPWLRQKNMCPMCRQEVESADEQYNEWKRQQATAPAASTSTSTTAPQAPTR